MMSLPLRPTPAASEAADPFLTIDQVALQLQLSASTVRRRIKDGTIRVVRLGRLVRVALSEIAGLAAAEATSDAGPEQVIPTPCGGIVRTSQSQNDWSRFSADSQSQARNGTTAVQQLQGVDKMSERQPLHLSLGSGPVYEAGAVLLCVLAWPEFVADEAAMDERHAALCQSGVRLLADADEKWARSAQPIKPFYLSVAEDQVQRVWHELFRRLAERLAAARMAIPFLQEASGATPRLPRGMSRLSLNNMASVAAEDLGLSGPENVETRVWRPSRPVIHIATAVAVAARDAEGDGQTFTALNLLLEEATIRWVADAAESYVPLLAALTQFRVPPEGLIRLRVT